MDLEHRYSNEAERSNWDIYDDFKLILNPFGIHDLYTVILRCKGLNLKLRAHLEVPSYIILIST